jgi:1,4-alpha-glucan branching enzyme
MPSLSFVYYTGIERTLWWNPRLTGSWNGWVPSPMEVFTAPDGCPAFRATVEVPPGEHRWGVFVDSRTRNNIWAVMDEAGLETTERHRTVHVGENDAPRTEEYWFTHCRRLGAQKRNGEVYFAVWAPNATAVEVVFGDASGYIADGAQPGAGTIALARAGGGVWESRPGTGDFAAFEGRPYMYRITRGNGDVRYRTDLYSRSQIGRGRIDPAALKPEDPPYNGDPATLDGTKSCSVIVDPGKADGIAAADFWRDELSHDRPLPGRIEDLVIYEVHIGSLGFGETGPDGQPRPGTLADAASPRFLDHLEDLGVNAIELLPIMEFAGDRQWGYATSHFSALESSAGGRDALKRLVKACHQRGIAVILDVVYNHYHHDAERAQWAYDHDTHDRNLYYWYEGKPSDYPQYPPGGYVDNESTGYAPRYSEEMVRKLLIGSAVTMVEEFHVDGFRVDQTSSIRAYNKLHLDGRGVGAANAWGEKFLRQFARTVKLVDPAAVLIAEDHEKDDAELRLTRPTDQGGVGFDAAWFSSFYHSLIGDAKGRSDGLIREAGFGHDGPLRLDYFAGALRHSRNQKVVYGESHDEAGNAEQTARTIVTAANHAPLTGDTRRFAEARCRFAFAMAVLSPGTPMLLAGDEIGAANVMRHNDPLGSKEDLFGERAGAGAKRGEGQLARESTFVALLPVRGGC